MQEGCLSGPGGAHESCPAPPGNGHRYVIECGDPRVTGAEHPGQPVRGEDGVVVGWGGMGHGGHEVDHALG